MVHLHARHQSHLSEDTALATFTALRLSVLRDGYPWRGTVEVGDQFFWPRRRQPCCGDACRISTAGSGVKPVPTVTGASSGEHAIRSGTPGRQQKCGGTRLFGSGRPPTEGTRRKLEVPQRLRRTTTHWYVIPVGRERHGVVGSGWEPLRKVRGWWAARPVLWLWTKLGCLVRVDLEVLGPRLEVAGARLPSPCRPRGALGPR